jgi:hypothetical protein
MKKLMMTLAAALSATAVVAEVTSANIVGYQNITAGSGFTVLAPTFVTVGESKVFTLGAVTGDFEEFDSLQFFNAGGNVNQEVFWLTADSSGGVEGWHNDSIEYMGDTVVDAGTAIFVSTASGATVMLSGQVEPGDVEIAAGVGFTVAGNSTPVDMTLADLQLTNIQEFDSLQFFDAGGNVNQEVFWLTADSSGGVEGWHNDSVEYQGGVTLPAGKGFFLSSAAGGVTLTIPAPVL